MSKKRRQIELPDYPEALLKPLPLPATAEQIARCLDALSKHYGIGANTAPVMMGNPYVPQQKKPFPWDELALRLMQDFVPAFRAQRRKTASNPVPYPHAHEAWLVRMVDALQDELKAKDATATRSAAFDRLLDRLRRQSAPRWRFNDFKKTSLAQAWKNIKGDIKKNPDKYLPPKPPLDNGPGFSMPGTQGELWIGDFLGGEMKTLMKTLQFTTAHQEFWDSMPALPGRHAR